MFLALLLLLTPHAAHAIEAGSPQWRALLHFPGASGGHSSVAKGSPFFLVPEGHDDPAAELAATEKYFHERPEEAACRYPARALVLGFPESHCGRWTRWHDALRAKGAELVFASAFLSSPSSMYGHTLLKFPRSGQSEGEDLLDYTLSYGANTGTSVGLPYIWFGLTGGFNGAYATEPFYLKVRDYNFVENRDFWIYPLNLTERELKLLAAHSWELREVAFPYYFLHRNCAFYLLELLEVVRAGSDLAGHFRYSTIPMDTIRLLRAEGLLGSPRFRPSRYRRLKALRERLGPHEAGVVETLANFGEAPLTPGREALELDAAYELWRYRYEGTKPPDPSVEGKLLSARSRFPEAPPKPDFSAIRPPEEGHPSDRAHLGYGIDRAHPFVEAGYRASLHDILADPLGYEEYGDLTMGDIRAREEDGKIFLERFDVMRLRSLAPREEWFPRWAWAFRTGFERAKEFSCTAWGCSAGELEAGGGASARLGPLLGYALVQLGVEAGKPFDRHYRVGVGPTGGVFTPLWRGARALVEGEWRFRLLGSQTPRHGANAGLAQTFSRNWETRATFEVARGYREGLLQMNYYF